MKYIYLFIIHKYDYDIIDYNKSDVGTHLKVGWGGGGGANIIVGEMAHDISLNKSTSIMYTYACIYIYINIYIYIC